MELHTDLKRLGCSFKDKEVQRDAKMVSYKVVDKAAKPYVEVTVADEKKVNIC